MYLLIIALVVSLLLSAFFSGMEIAFVSSNKLRFEVEKHEASIISAIISKFYSDPNQYITTLLLGNNLTLVVFSLSATHLLEPYLAQHVSSPLLVSFLISVAATIVVLIFGEFIPKSIFSNNPNVWMRIFAPLLYVIYVLLYPFAMFSTWLAALVLRVFGVDISVRDDNKLFSRTDLNYLVQENIEIQENNGEIETEMQIFQNVLDFSKVKLRDCLVPRPEITALPYDVSVEELRDTFSHSGFSKIPIYKHDIDNIIGYVHASEMFRHQDSWRDYITPIPIVPENMAAQTLMNRFMQEKRSIAVVVDEFGGTAGIVTLEDILEEIFGEIRDEHDIEEYTEQQMSDHEFYFSGRLEVDEVNEKYGLQLPLSDEYETIGGLVLHELSRFPKMNETIQVGTYSIKCVKMKDNRIELVKITS